MPDDLESGSRSIIVPQERGMKVSWALGAVGCLAAVVCMSAAILIPILQSAGSGMESQNCRQNLRRLGRALLLYAEANGGRLPGENWHMQIRSEEPDDLAYSCPHQRRIDPRSSGYALNKEVAGKKLADIQLPQQVPMVFDSRATVPGTLAEPADAPRPGRHRNGRMNNVVYVDGRVGEVPAK